jgi:hypothetical protein
MNRDAAAAEQAAGAGEPLARGRLKLYRHTIELQSKHRSSSIAARGEGEIP